MPRPFKSPNLHAHSSSALQTDRQLMVAIVRRSAVRDIIVSPCACRLNRQTSGWLGGVTYRIVSEYQMQASASVSSSL